MHQRGTDAVNGALDVTDDKRRFDPNYAISGVLERRITAGVSSPAFTVIRAIDLDHEALRGGQEIRDEAPEQRHLPAKDDA